MGQRDCIPRGADAEQQRSCNQLLALPGIRGDGAVPVAAKNGAAHCRRLRLMGHDVLVASVKGLRRGRGRICICAQEPPVALGRWGSVHERERLGAVHRPRGLRQELLHCEVRPSVILEKLDGLAAALERCALEAAADVPFFRRN